MKLKIEKCNYILIEAVDISETYRHIAMVHVDSLISNLRDALLVLPHINGRSDMELNITTDCIDLVKAGSQKNIVFPGWQQMMKETSYCFAETSDEECESVFDKFVEQPCRENCIVSSKGFFRVSVTDFMNEDGGLIEYQSTWIPISGILKFKKKPSENVKLDSAYFINIIESFSLN